MLLWTYLINTDEFNHIILKGHCINTTSPQHVSTLKGAIFREYNWFTLAAWGKKWVSRKVNKSGDSFCLPMLLECINYTPWRRTFKGWNCLSDIRCEKSGVLIVYVCTYRCLFDVVTPVHGYIQDQVYGNECSGFHTGRWISPNNWLI